MTRRESALEAIRYHHPKTERQLMVQCGFSLRPVGGGAYRDAYQIIGTDLIIKLPRCEGQSIERIEYSIEHSWLEVDAIRKVMKSKAKRWQMFKPLMPEILYFNHTYGTIVMPKYKRVGHKRHSDTIRKLEYLVNRYHGVEDSDLHNAGNWAEDKDGNLKLIDMGCFLEGNTTCPSN